MSARAAETARYWRFFWPLALGAVFLLAGQQAYNGVLARVGDPVRELAVYACAAGVFFLFDVGTAFMPNLVTVYARSPRARRRVLAFCTAVGVAFALPVLALGLTAGGAALLGWLYALDAGMLADVRAYLALFSGLVLLHVFHHYFNGLLILAERTTLVSAIGVAGVAIGVGTALWGLGAGWSPVRIIASAEWFGGLFKLGAQCLAWRSARASAGAGDGAVPRWGELMAFFWPVCVSGMTFGISRPLVFVFVARVPGAPGIIAAMRVAMDFLMLYQSVVNQFRHFFAAFGTDDLPAKRAFMGAVAAAMTLAMGALLALPAASDAFFLDLLALGPALAADAHRMCVLLLVVPSILMVRNYYHGILIARRRTTAMATGSAVRVAAIAGCSWLLLATGTLGAGTAVLAMIAGFVAEMLVAWRAVRRAGS